MVMLDRGVGQPRFEAFREFGALAAQVDIGAGADFIDDLAVLFVLLGNGDVLVGLDSDLLYLFRL